MALSKRERARLTAIATALSDEDPQLAALLSARWHRRGIFGRIAWIATMLILGTAPIAGVVGISQHSLLWVCAAVLGILFGITVLAVLCHNDSS